MINAGIRINGRHSYEDFGLNIKTRSIGLPERKMVTATVPYMSGYYDFSGLAGEPAYESRELTYTFDILEDTPEEAETLKNRVLAWVTGALNTRLYDDDDPNYCFEVSYQSSEYTEDDEIPEMGGEFSVTFLAQPYRYDVITGEKVI